jgi:hypothetical protein
MEAFHHQIAEEQRAAGVRVIKPPHALGFLDPDLPSWHISALAREFKVSRATVTQWLSDDERQCAFPTAENTLRLQQWVAAHEEKPKQKKSAGRAVTLPAPKDPKRKQRQMKNPNQIEQKTKRAAHSAQPLKRSVGSRRIRVRLRVPMALHAAIKKGANRLGLTMSAFVERAVREALPLIESDNAPMPRAGRSLKGGAK